MFKKKRINYTSANLALREYRKIPIQFHEVDLESCLEISYQHNVYAYDAYFLICAKNLQVPLISLDKQLISKAKEIGIKVKEVV